MQHVDPLRSPAWNDALLDHPSASIFHTTHWLHVLQASYGYQPYYFAHFQAQRLRVLLPCMEVSSWLTGLRGVALPFTDYCEPLIDGEASFPMLYKPVISVAQQRGWQFLEVRGGETLFPGVSPYASYARHHLTLSGQAADVFARLRRNYRTRIHKASSHDLVVACLRSPEAMAAYYRLHCLTRQRQGLPPQPASFFRHIQERLIANNLGFVTLVSYQGRQVAGAVFFTFGARAIYKFGASDTTYNHVYPNYLLFWHVIQWLCRHQYQELCFGRTALSNTGLMQFKEGWGTRKSLLHYYRYNMQTRTFVQSTRARTDAGHPLCRYIPLPLLRWAGAALYRHMG